MKELFESVIRTVVEFDSHIVGSIEDAVKSREFDSALDLTLFIDYCKIVLETFKGTLIEMNEKNYDAMRLLKAIVSFENRELDDSMGYMRNLFEREWLEEQLEKMRKLNDALGKFEHDRLGQSEKRRYFICTHEISWRILLLRKWLMEEGDEGNLQV